MKLLIKFPTRGREHQFFNVIDQYYDMLDSIEDTIFLISCDVDDDTMNNPAVKSRFAKYQNLQVYYGTNKSKIEAVNADLQSIAHFDIVLLASDDMVSQVKGFDTVIRNKMREHFPNTDGILWFNDGYQGRNLNTLSILGFQYYKRFNYLYHPSYKSLWCDNEFMQVGKMLGKQVYIDEVIIRHMHPDANSDISYDALYEKNLKLESVDKDNFLKRRKNGFDLSLWTRIKWKLKTRFSAKHK